MFPRKLYQREHDGEEMEEECYACGAWVEGTGNNYSCTCVWGEDEDGGADDI